MKRGILILGVLFVLVLLVGIGLFLIPESREFIQDIFVVTQEPRLAPTYTGCGDSGLDTGGRNCQEIVNCGDLPSDNIYYLVMNDVSSSGTCFTINADDITLDLNNYMVTYANVSFDQVYNIDFEIEGATAQEADGWDFSLASNAERAAGTFLPPTLYSGSYSIKINTPAPGNQIITSINPVVLQPGQTYVLAGSFYNQVSESVKIVFEVINDTGDVLATSRYISSAGGDAGITYRGFQFIPNLRGLSSVLDELPDEIDAYFSVPQPTNAYIRITVWGADSVANDAVYIDYVRLLVYSVHGVFGDTASGLNIYNGILNQSNTDCLYCFSIKNQLYNSEVSGITAYFGGAAVGAITPFTSAVQTNHCINSSIHDNTFYHYNYFRSDPSDWIIDRDNHQSPIIECTKGRDGDTLIYNNNIFGAPQDGIFFDIKGSGIHKIYNNSIRHDSKVTQAFAITVYGAEHTEIYDNKINLTSGRGIWLGPSVNMSVYDNQIRVAEKANQEYSGSITTYGIQIECEGTCPADYKIYNNYIEAVTHITSGNAIGLRVVESLHQNGQIYNNTFVAMNEHGAGYWASAFSAAAIDGSPVRIYNNTFKSNNRLFSFDEASNFVFESNTIEKISPVVSPFYTAFFSIYNSPNNVFLDTKRINNPSFDEVFFGSGDFTVKYYLDVEVLDGGSPVLDGTVVSIEDAQGSFIYPTTTGGNIPKQTLTEFFNNNGAKTTYSPYNVSVTYNGETQSKIVDINVSKDETFIFTGALPSVSYADCVEAVAAGVNQGKTCLEVIGCQSLSTANTYYLLMNDVSSTSATCFDVTELNITFDLNNYIFSYDTPIASTPFIHVRLNGDDFELKNGFITETGLGGSGFSSFRLGAILFEGVTRGSIHDIEIVGKSHFYPMINFDSVGTFELYNNVIFRNDTITDEDPSTQVGAVHMEYQDSHVKIYNNTFSGQTPLIFIGRVNRLPIGNTVEIFNNTFLPVKYIKNPYAIVTYGSDGGEIYDNTLISNNARGFLIQNSFNYAIHDNYIDVTEEDIPGVQMIGGAFGLRFRSLSGGIASSGNITAYNNYIIARTTTNSGAFAGKFSFSPPPVPPYRIYNNIFVAIKNSSNDAFAVSLEDGSFIGNVFANNTLISNYGNMKIGDGNGGLSDGNFVSNTFVKTGSDPGYSTLAFYYWVIDPINNIFIDSRFVNGSSFDNVNYITSAGNKDFTSKYYLDVHVQDSGGSPLVSSVEIRNVTEGIVFSGSTDVSGNIPTQNLIDFFETAYGVNFGTRYTQTPHNITVTYNGETQSKIVDINVSKSETFVFGGSSTPTCEATGGGICYYVDQNNIGCSDSGPGNWSVPFCTITASNNAHTGGDHVYILPGEYREVYDRGAGKAATIILPKSGPSINQKTNFIAMGNVILNGGFLLSSWIQCTLGDPVCSGVVSGNLANVYYSSFDRATGGVFEDGSRFWWTNSVSEINSSGKTFFSNGNIYVWTTDSQNPNTHVIEVANVLPVHLAGKQNVSIEGFNITNGHIAGMWLEYSYNIDIFNNTIGHTSRTTSNNVGGVWAGFYSENIHIKGNTIFDVVDPDSYNANSIGIGCADLCFNNTIIEDNIITDVANGVYFKNGGDNITVRNNTVYSVRTNALNIENIGVNNVWFYGNTIYDSPVGIKSVHTTQNVSIFHNSIYDVGESIVLGTVTGVVYNAILRNNLIQNNRNENSFQAEFHLTPCGLLSETDSDYNMFFRDSGVLAKFYYYSSCSWVSGLVYNLTGWQSATGLDLNSIEADPMLVNPPFDFNLRLGSPAIDNGTIIPGYHCLVNYETDPNQQNCRVWYGSAPDIGAYEFVSAPIVDSSDVNNDGVVNIIDFSLVVFNQNQVGPNYSHLDVNGDSNINLLDFIELMLNFG